MKNTIALKYLGILLVCLLFVRPSVGSYFTVWAGSGCSNQAATYSNCGCTNVASNLHGGYQFVYQGQTAAAYNAANCDGVAHTRFTSSVSGCTTFGWNSFFIQC
ncbi:hypothetical protein SUGI_0540460 [Cryptomeria japonica]|nr:hypothetical protein SUGI_0540460 [Cryptomeria japonica]